MSEWDKPKKIDQVDFAFPADVIGRFLPLEKDIPEEYSKNYHPMVKIVNRLFFHGLPKETVFHGREGVDGEMAFRQIHACLKSFQPKHEHKISGVAYLLDLFFEKIDIPNEDNKNE